MTATAGQIWAEANQRYLMAALDEVRGLLKRRTTQGEGGETESERPAESPDGARATSDDISPPPVLETLCATLELSPFERQLLLMCAGIELDGSFPALCAAAQGDLRRDFPTFSLALAALPDAHWSALAPTSPLRYWRLIEVGPGPSLTASPLRIDERILNYLAGVPHPDERLLGMFTPIAPQCTLVPSHDRLAGLIAEAWSKRSPAMTPPVVCLCGDSASDKRDIAATAGAYLGLNLYAVQSGLLPVAFGEVGTLIRLLEREAALTYGVMFLECDDLDTHDASFSAAMTIADRMKSPLILSVRDRKSMAHCPMLTIDVNRPSQVEQRELWMSEGKKTASIPRDQVESLVSQFDLSSRNIRDIRSIALLEADAPDCPGAGVWDACRKQARPRLEHLAQRIVPAASWNDLVIPEPQRQTLREVALHVRQRSLVYGEWGFAAASSRGLGISALFEGASGTGKTMAAEVLANELRLDLFRIDLSQVVSKYIGETEKNLGQVFDAAESGGVILLFDEADALYSKRSEIKDSHDRYANIEVSYLLQRMESYRGLAILTTNMKSSLDAAFMRRIRFVVQFPFPDAGYRAEIWKRVFPQQTPTDGLDLHKLARLTIAGGSIRNIALNAAFLAAGDGGQVRMTHLLQATRSEYAKMEKSLSSAEIGGWT